MLRRVWVWGECVHMCVSLPFTTLWMLELCFHGNADPWESMLFFFHTSSLFAIPLSPSLSSILPSHSSSPVLSPTRIASLSSFAIVYQSNKEKNTLYSLSAPAQSILFSGCVSSFSFQDIFTLLTHIHAQTQRIRNSPSSSLYSDIVQSQFVSSLDLFVSRPLWGHL